MPVRKPSKQLRRQLLWRST